MPDGMPPCPEPEDHVRVVHLQHALTTNRIIGAAVGVIMSRELLTYDQAFALLRTASARLNRRVSDLAAETLETGMTPSDRTDAGNSTGKAAPPPTPLIS